MAPLLSKRSMKRALFLASVLVVSCNKDAPKNGVVQVTADSDGFKPASVQLKKGVPAALVFTRTTDETCATEVVFPDLEIEKKLPKGEPVRIDIPTDKEQKLTFQCGMGMYKSAVVVVAN